MNDIRKLIEALEKIEENYSVENDEVEAHLEQAAKALAKDAVIQASGVWQDEGDGEGRFYTGAKTGAEYVRAAAPKFLDKEYKQTIMNSFTSYFNDYVEYFIEYVGQSNESVEEAKGSEMDINRDAAINMLVDAMEAELRSVARSRPNVDDKTLLGMARYILRGVESEVEGRFKNKVDQVSVDLDNGIR